MKLKPFASRLFLGIAGILFASSTQSEAALSYNDGDLFLSFRATGGQGVSVDYMVNLGNAATFTTATEVLVLDTEIGNILADLNVQYGSWQTRVDFLWSVSGVKKTAGGGFIANTMFVTNTHTSNLTLGMQDSTAWIRPSVSGATTPAGKVQSMGQAFALGDTDGVGPTAESANSSFALIQPTGNTNSYRSMMPGGANSPGAAAFGYFNSATGIEGNFGSGGFGTVLDFYNLSPISGGQPGTFEGTFSIDNNATVTFTPAAVPEPASIAAIAGGLAVLAGVRRRRAVN